MHRNQYTCIEDFLTDVSFQKWVRLQEDTQDWATWALELPERSGMVLEASIWVLAMKVSEVDLTAIEIENSLNEIKVKIDQYHSA